MKRPLVKKETLPASLCKALTRTRHTESSPTDEPNQTSRGKHAHEPGRANELGEMPGDHQQGAAGDDQIRMTPVEEGQHPGGQGDVDDVAPAPAQSSQQSRMGFWRIGRRTRRSDWCESRE